MVWSSTRLQEWFEDNDIGDLAWDPGDDEEDSGYVIHNYDRNGYDRGIIESCFTYNKKEGSWSLVDEAQDVKLLEHEDYDARARIDDSAFKFYIPQIDPPGNTDLTEYGKYQELKAMLAGAPTPMGNSDLDEMDYFLEWHMKNRTFPAYP